MAKFTVEIVTKNYWTVEVEADDEHMAEEKADDICQEASSGCSCFGGLLMASVTEKQNFPTLKYTGSEWEFYPHLQDST